MNNSTDEALKTWRYNHLVKDEWDSGDPINRFAVQIENNVRELQDRENLEAPFWIEADIRIVRDEDRE